MSTQRRLTQSHPNPLSSSQENEWLSEEHVCRRHSRAQGFWAAANTASRASRAKQVGRILWSVTRSWGGVGDHDLCNGEGGWEGRGWFGDTGMEAGNKRQRGPLGRKAWGARRWMPASTARARRACVCARSRWCRRDAGGLSCVCGPESVLHSPSMRYCGARGQTCGRVRPFAPTGTVEAAVGPWACVYHTARRELWSMSQVQGQR